MAQKSAIYHKDSLLFTTYLIRDFLVPQHLQTDEKGWLKISLKLLEGLYCKPLPAVHPPKIPTFLLQRGKETSSMHKKAKLNSP